MNGIDKKTLVIIIYGSYLAVLSIITFLLYYIDKRRAVRGKWRISEKVLLFLAFIGGAYGGYPAMLIFRHKTKGEHWYFTFINFVGIVIHTIILILAIFVFRFN